QSIGRSSELMHEILIAHITTSILSYGFFTLSFLLATMYLIQYYLLKKKKGLKAMWRFSNLDRLDLLSSYAVVIGVLWIFCILLCSDYINCISDNIINPRLIMEKEKRMKSDVAI